MSKQPSRRAFVRLTAASALAPVVLPGAAPAAQPIPVIPKPLPVPTLASALTEVIHQRYGKHLSSADLEKVAAHIGERLSGLERMRAVPLTNADEPDTIFSASDAEPLK